MKNISLIQFIEKQVSGSKSLNLLNQPLRQEIIQMFTCIQKNQGEIERLQQGERTYAGMMARTFNGTFDDQERMPNKSEAIEKETSALIEFVAEAIINRTQGAVSVKEILSGAIPVYQADEDVVRFQRDGVYLYNDALKKLFECSLSELSILKQLGLKYDPILEESTKEILTLKQYVEENQMSISQDLQNCFEVIASSPSLYIKPSTSIGVKKEYEGLKEKFQYQST